ncbi:Msr family ABC-F type ribosomal protection protein [Bacillus sp. SM2101]|uniref:Msr family ABC-F type ribosomal protection protein n=1 Tax=Bacillus sp. SM2101 TaxID=2805366 RepID=UPI001BDE7A13|nr:ABC-F type ribosomal protection protein [Bacillus sp. SM2101]
MEHICFEFKNIEMTYLDKRVLRIERLAVHQFDRIGIVGKNGAGKSTLIKLLSGIVQPSVGKVHRYVEHGYFEQISAPTTDEADPSLLGRLAVPQNSNHLSGGEQTRLKLAQLFTHYYEALLIDEPTTHLDQEGISYLLDELRYYYGALIIVSHDRAVLDKLTTSIWEVDEGEVHVYKGNYSEYVEQKQLEREQQNQAHAQYMKEQKRLAKEAQEKMKKAEKVAQAGSMSRKEAKAKANRMFESKSKGTCQKAVHRAAKAIEQRKDRLKHVEAVKEEKQIVFHQSKALELHNKFPIMADRFSLELEDRRLLDEVSFQLPLGKIIAITGENGSGKSTLLKHIASHAVGLTITPKARIGFFRQMSYQFTSDETILQFMKNRSEYDEGSLRSALHSMLFLDSDLLKKVNTLSGGEAMRLQLCLLFLGEYNILLLDEPTNFLDTRTIEALERFICAYKGTIIFVSHDTRFIKNVAELRLNISDKKLQQQCL